MKNRSNAQYRRRLIARVEALIQEALMPKPDFHQQIGPVASEFWTKFTTSSDEEAWNHFSMKGIDRIGRIFGVGSELLHFKS